MFKKFGEWFDSLWETHEPHQSVTGELADSSIAKVVKHPVVTQDNIYGMLSDRTTHNKAVIFTRNYSYRTYEWNKDTRDMEAVKRKNTERYVVLPWFSGGFTAYHIGGSLDSVIGDAKPFDPAFVKLLFTDASSVMIDTVDTDVLIKAEQERVELLLSKTKAYTAPRYFQNTYINRDGDNWELYVDERKIHITDINRLYIVRSLLGEDLYDSPKYIVLDYEKVDRKLLPHTHWRRWAAIKELTGAESKWAIRIVPDDIARGPIRYFGLEFNFDAARLGGISFDFPWLVTLAVRDILNKCDAELIGEAKGVCMYTGNKQEQSTVFINLKNIRVKHKDVDSDPVAYVTFQNKHLEFHNENPYLNPNVEERRINDNYIGFDGGDNLYHYTGRDCKGDIKPHGRHTNQKEKARSGSSQ